MTRVEIEVSLQILEKEYLKIVDEFYEFRKNPSVEGFFEKKEEYLAQLCVLEDRIAEKQHQLSNYVQKVNKTCSRTRCAQCINHNKCGLEYVD